jgi:hypothetical protein
VKSLRRRTRQACRPGSVPGRQRRGRAGRRLLHQALAETGWSKLVVAHEELKGINHRVIAGKADIGTVYRLQAVPGDLASANALCSKLQAGGVKCQVKR